MKPAIVFHSIAGCVTHLYILNYDRQKPAFLNTVILGIISICFRSCLKFVCGTACETCDAIFTTDERIATQRRCHENQCWYKRIYFKQLSNGYF